MKEPKTGFHYVIVNFLPASPGSVAAFNVILAMVIVAFHGGVYFVNRADPGKARRLTMRTAVVATAWLGLLSWLVGSGTLQRFPFAGIPFFFGAVLLASLAVGLSPLGGRLATGLPMSALVGFQSFRLPLELVLHSWSEQGTIPSSMTWNGQNWDIISGIMALAAIPFVHRLRALAVVVNCVGFALLLNVIRVAVMSSPLPIGWNVSPPLLLALHLPYALIGPVCVSGALIGHIVLTRALIGRST